MSYILMKLDSAPPTELKHAFNQRGSIIDFTHEIYTDMDSSTEATNTMMLLENRGAREVGRVAELKLLIPETIHVPTYQPPADDTQAQEQHAPEHQLA